MRILCNISVLILLHICTSAQDQGCTLRTRYLDVRHTLDQQSREIMQMFDSSEHTGGSKPALIEWSIDTLNKDRIVYTKFIEGTRSPRVAQEIGGAYGYFSNDTLIVIVGGILANESIEHRFCRGDVQTTYTEWFKYDPWLRKNAGDEPTNRISLGVDHDAFEVCQEGNVVYGYAKFATRPYFKLDRYNPAQFLEIRKYFEYYFKFELE